MTCAKCNSDDVTVVPIVSGKIKRRGFFSTLFNLILVLCTGGVWLIVMLISGGSKGSISTTTEAVCAQCHYRWKV